MTLPRFVLHGAGAADLTPGTWLLEASAGTGKTYTIVGIVLRLIVEQGVPIERMVLMTFTRAATAELRERLRRGLHDALAALNGQPVSDPFLQALAAQHQGDELVYQRLLLAVAGLDQALVVTIHGVCNRLLGDHALHAGAPLGADLDGDLGPWREATVYDLLRDWAHRLEPDAASLAGPHLDPDTLIALCRNLERHPLAKFTGAGAVDGDELTERIAAARASWPDWRRGIEAFYAARSDQIGTDPELGLRHLPKALGRVGAMLDGSIVGAEMTALLTPILNPNQNPKKPRLPNKAHLKALAQEDWHQGLLKLVQIGPGIQRQILESYRHHLLARPRTAQHLHYNDLLVALDDAIDGPSAEALRSAVSERYDVVLVDEFQDTDPLQWRILDGLFRGPGKRLFLIGDPKQAIYAFRGADVHAYLAVASDPVLTAATLSTNFRSDEALVAAVNGLFDRPQAFVDPAIGFAPVDAAKPVRFRGVGFDSRPCQLWWQEPVGSRDATSAAIEAAVAQEIVRLLAQGEIAQGEGWRPVDPRDIAILVRSHGEGDRLAAALAALATPVPSVRNLRHGVFDGALALELLSVLTAILAPHRNRLVRAAALTRMCGLTPADLAGPAIDALSSRLRALRQAWLERGFVTMWQAWLDQGWADTTPRLALARCADGERALTDLLHLGDLLAEVADADRLSPEAVVEWLQARIVDPAEAGEDQLLRLDRDDDAVRIVTIHTSKGLQFPVVFVPSLWAGRGSGDSGLYHEGHQACWFFGNHKPHKVEQAQATAALAEDMRLAYVALTRAEHRCYLAYAPHPARSGPGCKTAALTWLAACAEACTPETLVSWAKPGDAAWEHRVRQALASPQVAVVETPAAADVDWQPRAISGPAASAVAPWQARRRERWFSSYSGLVRNRPVDEPDHDQQRIEQDDAEQAEERSTELVDDLLPRGARFGTALHAVFEYLPFDADRQAIHIMCAQQLREQGFDDGHAARLALLVERTLAAEVPGLDLPLRSVATQRQAELEVLLPVTRPHGLAQAFADHGGEWQSYASDIVDLELPGGFFTAIIDLLFSYQGRVHILDWKSNDLSRKGGYGQAALRAEMRHHHYVLQYHLYLVAVHRLLRLRLPDYDYERHVGSAHYVFARGIDGTGAGWYAQRPSGAMIEALDACFGDGHA
ncbi:MAG: UvrD-helicase domain-containing protein [Planctomycetota bacterium]|jgi:exodeoxyribonuclease V beta subunit|nr:UvrD-helicase domain-containing protein [Planctomycetota bacterium]